MKKKIGYPGGFSEFDFGATMREIFIYMMNQIPGNVKRSDAFMRTHKKINPLRARLLQAYGDKRAAGEIETWQFSLFAYEWICEQEKSYNDLMRLSIQKLLDGAREKRIEEPAE